MLKERIIKLTSITGLILILLLAIGCSNANPISSQDGGASSIIADEDSEQPSGSLTDEQDDAQGSSKSQSNRALE